MAFTGRSYGASGQNFNRIVNSGFNYDLNGNLKDEPAHDGLSALSYSFTPENKLARVTPEPANSHPGTSLQAALYEGGDHRWFRSVWQEGSKALITLRDASGQVVADYEESSATSGLELKREYIHANGQLVAINSTCGPRPALALANPSTVGTTVWFDKTRFGIAAVRGYTLAVRTDSGQFKSILLPSDTPDNFGVSQSQFFPGVTNWIQIETDASCGHTGYSNAVSYSYTPTGGGTSCLSSMGSHRADFTKSGSNLKLQWIDDCPSHTLFRAYYFGDEYESAFSITGPDPVSDASVLLSDVPCGSGEGQYWVTAVDPHTQVEFDSSPVVQTNATSCGGGGDGATTNATSLPGQPGMNVQYVHWDHLGSTRLVTDENGVSLAGFKYYPFGMEAESTGADELRQKFTGHECDDAVGLDYMMARSCRMALGRFLQPDEYDGSMRPGLPQSWNRYAYVLNNPMNATDPDGYAEKVRTTTAKQGGGEPVTPEPSDLDQQPDNSTQAATQAENIRAAQMAVARAWLFGGEQGGAAALSLSIARVGDSGPSVSAASPEPSKPKAQKATASCMTERLIHNFAGSDDKAAVTITLNLAAGIAMRKIGTKALASLLPGPGWLYVGTATIYDVGMIGEAFFYCKDRAPKSEGNPELDDE